MDRSLPSSSPQRLARKRSAYISPSQQQNSGLKRFQSLLDTGCLPHGTDFSRESGYPVTHTEASRSIAATFLLFCGWLCGATGVIILARSFDLSHSGFLFSFFFIVMTLLALAGWSEALESRWHDRLSTVTK